MTSVLPPTEATVEFFYTHAPYSWLTKSETEEQGHRRCAVNLAIAEVWADREDIRFEWTVEDGEWAASAYRGGDLVAAIGGLGDADGSPTAEYQRVMEAQLAAEVMAERGAPW